MKFKTIAFSYLKKLCQISVVWGFLFIFFSSILHLQTVSKAQTKQFTIPEIFAYLNTKVPSDQFKTKEEIISFLIREILNRKVEKPLTPDIENVFRQVGATNELIETIAKNNPTSPISSPTPNTVEPPFTLLEIRNQLRKLTKEASQKELIAKIENQKVSEPLTNTIEAFLVKDGATPELIEAIKKNPVGPSIPPKTPTPTPTPTPPPPPLSILEIREEFKKLKPNESQKELISLIEQRKVRENLDKIVEDFLKSDGATPELIEAIKKNQIGTSMPASNSNPSPTPTPPVEIENKLGIKFALIKAGSFRIGSEDGEDDEKPVRQINLQKDFYLGKYEITQAEYEKLMGTNPSSFKECPNCPVDNVSWKEAKTFVGKLNTLNENFIYDLPSEAEWEYAARANSTTIFAFGNQLTSDQANFNGTIPFGTSPKGVFLKKTTPVGTYQPNAWGLYDMHGNAWEWVEDFYVPNYNNLNENGLPYLATDTGYKVIRGGSCFSNGTGLRSANRSFDAPGNKSNDYGFRVVARPK
ncbi:MAG TPA: formylglycine-generating enzyme family protein [Pyrinomonadaceae bacterium]|nr:formylglycine-generating enzyme family protein [Pyrinomonadaceae bacterium]